MSVAYSNAKSSYDSDRGTTIAVSLFVMMFMLGIAAFQFIRIPSEMFFKGNTFQSGLSIAMLAFLVMGMGFMIFGIIFNNVHSKNALMVGAFFLFLGSTFPTHLKSDNAKAAYSYLVKNDPKAQVALRGYDVESASDEENIRLIAKANELYLASKQAKGSVKANSDNINSAILNDYLSK